MRVHTIGTALILAGIVLFAGRAEAVPALKFDDPISAGGTVAWPGAGGILGTDIQFQSILGLDTPLNAGIVLECVGCLLDFMTGSATAVGSPGGAFLITGDAGGTLVLTGAVPALGLPAGTTLLQGRFTGQPTELVGPEQGGGLFLGLGEDQKDPILAAFFGLEPVTFTIGTTSIQTLGTFDGVSGAFAGAVINADLNNTAVVPNPRSLLLLGLGFGAAWLGMRRTA